MTDECPDTGDAVLDGLMFGAVAAISIASGIVAGHALAERFKRKEAEQCAEIDR